MDVSFHLATWVTLAQATQGRGSLGFKTNILECSTLPQTAEFIKKTSSTAGEQSQFSPLQTEIYFLRYSPSSFSDHCRSGTPLGPQHTITKRLHAETANQKQITKPPLPPKHPPPGLGRCAPPQGSLNCGKETLR